jgi:hypothetical protein
MLFLVGLALGIVGGLWLIFVAFKQNPLWGLGVLFIPGVFVIFGIIYWKYGAAKPLIITILGAALFIAGRLLMPDAA